MKIRVTIDTTDERGRSMKRMLELLTNSRVLACEQNYSIQWEEWEDETILEIRSVAPLDKIWKRVGKVEILEQ